MKSVKRFLARISGAIVLLVGLGCLGAGAYHFWKAYRLHSAGSLTESTIIEIKENRAKRKYAPVYAYFDRAGIEWYKVGHYRYPPLSFAVGEKQILLVDPEHPRNAAIEISWMSAIMYCFMGAIIIALGVIVYRHGRKDSATS